MKSVRQRIMSRFSMKEFKSSDFRGLIMGCLIMFTTCEVTAYILLNQYITVGELPSYFVDALIVSLSVLEFIFAPFLSWLGYRRRRIIMMYCIVSVIIAITPVFVVSNPPAYEKQKPELCFANNTSIRFDDALTVSANVILLVVMAAVTVLTRATFMSHGVAYLDEHSPANMSIHVGILAVARILGLQMAPTFLEGLVSKRVFLILQVLFTIIPGLFNILQLFRFPVVSPVDEGSEPLSTEQRGFFTSICRVLSNKFAMSQIFSIAFVTTALWGFALHETDIIKTRYHTVEPENWMITYSRILRYHIPVFVVVFIGSKFTQPLIEKFDKAKALCLCLLTALFLVGPYIVLVTILTCDKGSMAGLSENNYTQPMCSLGCGCKAPWDKFSPVCVTEQMTTYYSPCHAGCTVTQDINGIIALSNCTCALTTGRATFGACGDRSCSAPLELHKLIFTFIITMTVVALQAKFVMILRAVDPRDRSVALGIAFSTIALWTFVIGHIIYAWIRAETCAWSHGGNCYLHNSSFVYVTGGTSAGLAAISLIITITMLIILRRQRRRENVTLVEN